MDASILARLLDLAIRIQQIPSPTFDEAQRIAFLRERFTEISLEEITAFIEERPGFAIG